MNKNANVVGEGANLDNESLVLEEGEYLVVWNGILDLGFSLGSGGSNVSLIATNLRQNFNISGEGGIKSRNVSFDLGEGEKSMMHEGVLDENLPSMTRGSIAFLKPVILVENGIGSGKGGSKATLECLGSSIGDFLVSRDGLLDVNLSTDFGGACLEESPIYFKIYNDLNEKSSSLVERRMEILYEEPHA